MAGTIDERFGARRTDGQRATREYWIKGVTSDDDARTAMLDDADCPSTITVNGITYQRNDAACGVEEVETISSDGSSISSGVWIGGATWENPQGGGFQAPNSFHLSFDISGQSQKITHSRQTIDRSTTEDAVRDFKNGINVQADHTVDGAEIIVPTMCYTINYTFANDTVTESWIRGIAAVVGTMNTDTWHGFNAGECLLSRVTGQRREDTNWDISFGVSISYNETAITIGDIPSIDKLGWDYLWIYYEDREVTSGGVPRMQATPIQANVERVYRTTNYASALGI